MSIRNEDGTYTGTFFATGDSFTCVETNINTFLCDPIKLNTIETEGVDAVFDIRLQGNGTLRPSSVDYKTSALEHK